MHISIPFIPFNPEGSNKCSLLRYYRNYPPYTSILIKPLAFHSKRSHRWADLADCDDILFFLLNQKIFARKGPLYFIEYAVRKV